MDSILKELRKEMLIASERGKDGNLQSCFSSVEILWTLYDRFVFPEAAENERDRFVLSKGQSTLALMAVLAGKGLIAKEELYSFCRFDSRISMQADRTKFGGLIENSAGSLGHGFPMAVGMAWAKKIKNERGKIFCLAGDGEMNEGTMWEAAVFAASESLGNLVLIIDDNNSVGKMINMGDMQKKLEAFGFFVTCTDGHDTDMLRAALSEDHDIPHAVIAKTVRGWGSRTLMNDNSWFHRAPDKEELQMLLNEVDEF